MKSTKLDKRFFESTRGQIVLLLRSSGKTVNELVAELNLTDNAVRANLLTLERDGLVRQSGIIRGFRKPHFVYTLTDEVRHIFPSSYDTLFNQLLNVLKKRLSPSVLKESLIEVGKILGSKDSAGTANGSFNARLDKAVLALQELGGAAQIIEDTGGKVWIRSESCPFADVVSEHPEVCQLAEAMLLEITGNPVKESCDRSSLPKCRFQVDAL